MSLPDTRDFTAIDGVSQLPATTVNRIQDFIVLVKTMLGVAVALPSILSNVAQVLFKNAAGNPRWLIDHNGYPGGSINLFREEWKLPLSGVTAGGAVAGNPLWFLTVAGAPIGLSTQAPTTTIAGTYLGVVVNNTTNNKMVASSATQWMHPGCTFASWELKADFSMDQLGNNGFTYWCGFSGSRDAATPANGFAWFKKATGDTNWQCQTNNGTLTTTVDSGVPPTQDGTFQRLKIEFHGSASPYGASTVLFFINDVLVATITTNLPTALQYVVFGGLCTAGGTAHDCDVGTVEFNVNRYAAGATT